MIHSQSCIYNLPFRSELSIFRRVSGDCQAPGEATNGKFWLKFPTCPKITLRWIFCPPVTFTGRWSHHSLKWLPPIGIRCMAQFLLGPFWWYWWWFSHPIPLGWVKGGGRWQTQLTVNCWFKLVWFGGLDSWGPFSKGIVTERYP